MLKVMTLNINHYAEKHGTWAQRRELIQRTIREQAPDVVALQAVGKDKSRFDGVDQARQLANGLEGYGEVVFREASDAGNGLTVGSAFLSRRKIADTGCLRLSLRPGLEDKNQRILLKARIEAASGPISIFNAHFSWVYPQALDNFEESLAYVNSRNSFALWVGDLNITPERSLLQRFKQEGWVDVWAALRPEEAGSTFEADAPRQRIDYVFANHNLRHHLRDIRLLAEGDGATRLSDHLGLLVTLDLD